MYIIKDLKNVEGLVRSNYNIPHTVRQFKVESVEIYTELIKTYRDLFAFSICIGVDTHVFMKDDDILYFRVDDPERKQKPVCNHYDKKLYMSEINMNYIYSMLNI